MIESSRKGINRGVQARHTMDALGQDRSYSQNRFDHVFVLMLGPKLSSQPHSCDTLRLARLLTMLRYKRRKPVYSTKKVY